MIEIKQKLRTAISTTKSSVKKVNEFALKTTDEVIVETFTIAE